MKYFFFFSIVSLTIHCAPTPPYQLSESFKSDGIFHGGDTRNLNLEKFDFTTNGAEERLDIYFSAGSKKLPSTRIAPFQLRSEKMPNGSQRLLLLIQGIAGRYIHRNSLTQIESKSRLIRFVHIYPPLEDGDTIIEIALKTSASFKPETERRGTIRITLRETPNLANNSAPIIVGNQ